MTDLCRKPEHLEDFLPLVGAIARRYAHRGDMDDLLAAGSLGLVRAYGRYREGAQSFGVYAAWWISSEIRREVMRGRLITIPHHVFGQVGRHRRGDPISVTRFHNPEHLLGFLDQAIRIIDGLDGKQSLLDELPCDRDRGPDPDDIDELQSALALLDPLSRLVLSLRFGLDGSPPITRPEIGRAVGRDRSYARRVEKAALAFLRERLSPSHAEANA